MTQQYTKGSPAMTIAPLRSGSLIDASSVGDPARLDLGTVLETFHERGAVVIEGCDIGHQQFVDLTERLAKSFMEYVGGANNDRDSAFGQSKTVLTVTGGSAAKYAIPLHGEMFYTKPRPRTLFFCCIRPADENGQTTICDGAALWEALPASVQQVFLDNKLLYRRIYTDDGWKKVYKTDDLERVKTLCRDNGVTLTENADGSLETVHVAYAFHDHKAGRVFINSVLVWAAREYISGITDSKVRFEDGSELPKDVLYKVHEIAETLTVNVPWKPGSVAIVDNTRVMHGRRSYEDSKRDIIMRMSEDDLGMSALAAAE